MELIMAMTLDGSASVTINSGAILGITSGTAVASTSGTSIDFTGIPSWVKRITVMFNAVSLNSNASIIVQIGSGSVTTSGYVSGGNWLSGTTTNAAFTSTAGMIFTPSGGSANGHVGTMIFNLINSNTWVETMSGVISNVSTYTFWGAGSIALGGSLDRVRITSSSGTDTFDAGSINILYE
jgi:hypothetical protein